MNAYIDLWYKEAIYEIDRLHHHVMIENTKLSIAIAEHAIYESADDILLEGAWDTFITKVSSHLEKMKGTAKTFFEKAKKFWSVNIADKLVNSVKEFIEKKVGKKQSMDDVDIEIYEVGGMSHAVDKATTSLFSFAKQGLLPAIKANDESKVDSLTAELGKIMSTAEAEFKACSDIEAVGKKCKLPDAVKLIEAAVENGTSDIKTAEECINDLAGEINLAIVSAKKAGNMSQKLSQLATRFTSEATKFGIDAVRWEMTTMNRNRINIMDAMKKIRASSAEVKDVNTRIGDIEI